MNAVRKAGRLAWNVMAVSGILAWSAVILTVAGIAAVVN